MTLHNQRVCLPVLNRIFSAKAAFTETVASKGLYHPLQAYKGKSIRTNFAANFIYFVLT